MEVLVIYIVGFVFSLFAFGYILFKLDKDEDLDPSDIGNYGVILVGSLFWFIAWPIGISFSIAKLGANLAKRNKR